MKLLPTGFSQSAGLLIGREAELEILQHQFNQVSASRTSVVLVVGEPGIGKTRLLAEIARLSLENSWALLRGGNSQAEGLPPYLPFLEALGRYIRETPVPILKKQTELLGSILATILPELIQKTGELDSSSSYSLVPDQSRLRLFEGVGRFLSAIAGNQPLLLLLDDLQWADSASLDLLCYVVEHNASSRILIVGTCRSDELANNPALERSLLQLNRLRNLTTINLKPLSEKEIGQLANRKLNSPPGPALERTLYEQSEGNPFFAEELLSNWLETGALAPENNNDLTSLLPGHAMANTGPGQHLPSSIVGLIRQRLARFSPETAGYLQTAAIIGRNFDLYLLAEVAGQPVEVVEASLVETIKAGLVRPLSAEVLSFYHDKVRETLYAEVTPIRRKRLHGFIGRALELQTEKSFSGSLSLQQLAALAFHFSLSGDRARGADYAIQAANSAMEMYAFEAALNHFQAALDLLEPADQRRGQLWLSTGEAALLAGKEPGAVDAFQAGRDWYLKSGFSDGIARAAQGLGRARWRMDQLPQALAAFQEARARLEATSASSSDLVSVLVDLASLLAVSLSRLEEGLNFARKALAMAQTLGEKRLEASTCRSLGNLLVRSIRLNEGIALLEQALELAEAVDDPSEAAECCACLTMAYMWAGLMHKCEKACLARMEYALRCNEPYQLRHVYIMLGMFYFMEGKKPASDEMLAKAEEVVRQMADPEPGAFLLNMRSAIAYFEGDFARAEALMVPALAIFREMGPGIVVWYLSQMAIFQLLQGKEQEALEIVAEQEQLIASLPPGNLSTLNALTGLVEIAIYRRDRERAALYYPLLLPGAGLFIDMLVDRLLGELEILLGDLDKAARHLDLAEAHARSEKAMSHELVAILAARGDLILAGANLKPTGREKARAFYTEGLELARQHGYRTAAVLRIEEQLSRLSNPATLRNKKVAFPAGLSQREVEVLRLVAAGKSNREIAGKLTLSDKTVGNHVASILVKTGAENRAGAAAFAIRQGLA